MGKSRQTTPVFTEWTKTIQAEKRVNKSLMGEAHDCILLYHFKYYFQKRKRKIDISSFTH